jgi:pyrroline-5-carboxylate reductase
VTAEGTLGSWHNRPLHWLVIPGEVEESLLSMSPQLSEKKLAVIGAGKLGGILLRAYLKQGLFLPNRVIATVKHADRAAALAKELAITVTSDNREAVKGADIILLTVKPQTMADVLQEIAPELRADTLLVSVAASVPTSYVEQQLAAASGAKHRQVAIVRAMPNTPAAVGCGMTAICGGSHATPDHLEIARCMFDAVGRTIALDEKHMDAVTGLSASGPAFAYIILESLAEAGVKVGLPRDVATLLAAQMMKGAASVVLDTGHHPALLKDAVTTPAGCTIDGILELEEGKLRVTLIKAVVKATGRAGELLFEK